MKKLLLFITCLLCGMVSAQTYSVDARITSKPPMSGHLKMGNPGPAGKEILLNNKYITIGGKPVVPVMGEIHFSRCPKADWEERILKMKANGITIIATYVFWIFHEEIEGKFDWSGDNDFRSFIQLCQKHTMYVYPRIGPWCHGEVRNGGTPDWILSKKDLVDRSNNTLYQFYADRWYKSIAAQLEGLYYKDGGPIIGIQLENEYRRGPSGNAHILWLKQTAQKYGMDVPMYTVTGWGNASVPQDEVIPLFGGYPEEPWITDIQPATENPNSTFEAPMNDEGIGADVAGKEGKSATDHTRYPYLTCEIGLGNQISYHRRPILNQFDGLAIATTKTGSGSNLPGYYVFSGGSNPVGKLTTLEENQDETGYWNQYCDISYDFQAAIGETGELAPSYYQVKKLHYFLGEFGDRLAPMTPVIPNDQKPKNQLQWSVRVQGNSGFVFGLNYYRNFVKPLQKGVQLQIELPEGPLTFPSKPVDIKDSCIFIWPFNFDMEGVLLKYATAQPLCKTAPGQWFFIQNLGAEPEFCFDAALVKSVSVTSGSVEKKNNQFIVTDIKPGLNNSLIVRTKAGKTLSIKILSYEESNHAWYFKETNKLYLSDANLYINGNELIAYGRNPTMTITPLSGKGRYKDIMLFQPYKIIPLTITATGILDNAIWLKSTVKAVTPKNQLYHKIFCKDFSLDNASSIRTATLYLYAGQSCKIRLNDKWLNQEIKIGLNQLDVTGYLNKGSNVLLIDFPFEQGEKSFAAKLVAECFNADRTVLYTDESWLSSELYTFPFNSTLPKGGKKPETTSAQSPAFTSNEWTITLPENALKGVNNAYMHLHYLADMGRCYLNNKLVADNYFNGTTWSIELNKFSNLGPFKFEFTPLKTGYKIQFDKSVSTEIVNKAVLKKVEIIPEYKGILKL
jgi:hypothetical protein